MCESVRSGFHRSLAVSRSRGLRVLRVILDRLVRRALRDPKVHQAMTATLDQQVQPALRVQPVLRDPRVTQATRDQPVPPDLRDRPGRLAQPERLARQDPPGLRVRQVLRVTPGILVRPERPERPGLRVILAIQARLAQRVPRVRRVPQVPPALPVRRDQPVLGCRPAALLVSILAKRQVPTMTLAGTPLRYLI